MRDDRTPRHRRTLRHAVKVSVDNQRCHLYGFCQLEAPEYFQLAPGQRLRYAGRVVASQAQQVIAAARMCPMRAIHVSGERTP
ncbi:ferredoxin [Fodinicola acaciae]|uniref:ferredoxin n=1 Tax=Fodinicola acaciae TaxID=2681555 RepID=UPI0013D34B37|nr:ferredoxin [Fodinicola acaciae]